MPVLACGINWIIISNAKRGVFILEFNLHSINIYSITIRLTLALIIAGAVGYERGRRREFAGIRTYMLIALGSAMAMLINQYIFERVDGSIDPTRIGAQVLSGIGFLGAGTILVIGGQKIKGLTTAAGLWTTATIGLACGAGFYMGAVIGGVCIFTVITALEHFDYKVKHDFNTLWYYAEVEDMEVFSYIKEQLSLQDIEITDLRVAKEHRIFQLSFAIHLEHKVNLNPIIAQITKDDGIITLREERNM